MNVADEGVESLQVRQLTFICPAFKFLQEILECLCAPREVYVERGNGIAASLVRGVMSLHRHPSRKTSQSWQVMDEGRRIGDWKLRGRKYNKMETKRKRKDRDK